MSEIMNLFKHHPSIKSIETNIDLSQTHHFEFSKVTPEFIGCIMKSLNVKKSTGSDNLPPKIIKLSSDHIKFPISKIFNQSIDTGIFPDSLKEAEISPLFKKDDNMNKNNFRPVSVLACISKVFERVYNDQMVSFFKDTLSSLLSAFRK